MEEVARITGHTHLISLFGSPVAHSSSPVTHDKSFEKLGIDAVYLVFEVGKDGLETAVKALKTLKGWDGSNVTMPCKQEVIKYLDGTDDAAGLIGAVNVISKEEDGRVIGHNTDGLGFMVNLRKHGVNTKGEVMTLVGPGGAGSAILTQAALDGAGKINVFARQDGPSYKHAQYLIPRVAAKTGVDITLHDFNDKDDMAKCLAETDVLVNATPLGMGALADEMPVDPAMLNSKTVVAECPYAPRITKLMSEAEAKGCKAISGIGMMVEQAAAGERFWYGCEMPVDEIVKELFPDD